MSDKTENEQETEFEKRVKAALQDSEAELPEDVSARLGAIRREAVARVPERRSFALPGWWLAPAAAAAVMTLVLAVFFTNSEEIVPLLEGVEDSELLAAEDMELLEELEFLAWMEEQANAG